MDSGRICAVRAEFGKITISLLQLVRALVNSALPFDRHNFYVEGIVKNQLTNLNRVRGRCIAFPRACCRVEPGRDWGSYAVVLRGEDEARMAASKSYFELLKDPRWQRKRLGIMEKDGFTCVSCGDDDQTLNVHHGYYEFGLTPWEHPDNTLWTLCETCHGRAQEALRVLKRELGKTHPDFYDSLIDEACRLQLVAKYGPDWRELARANHGR